ncbi:MAG: hypothetical protein HRU21_06595, partial [Pseudomonadales bacterium]|nr:hypothetical protein [Pseudomonadales bacterium]
MNNSEPNLISSYGVAVFAALLIHASLLFWLSMDFKAAASNSLLQPKAIQASLISASAASDKTPVKPTFKPKP